MSEGILGNATGGFGFPRTYILTDDNGKELTGVYVENKTVFTASDNDVREGSVYASELGVSTGTKNIPSYRTEQGFRLISAGSKFSINLSQYNKYDYTKLQCVIAPFNTSMNNSVAVDKTVINDGVYDVGVVDKISDVTKNHDTKSIDLNIINTSENLYIIRYFTYKEEI